MLWSFYFLGNWLEDFWSRIHCFCIFANGENACRREEPCERFRSFRGSVADAMWYSLSEEVEYHPWPGQWEGLWTGKNVETFSNFGFESHPSVPRSMPTSRCSIPMICSALSQRRTRPFPRPASHTPCPQIWPSMWFLFRWRCHDSLSISNTPYFGRRSRTVRFLRSTTSGRWGATMTPSCSMRMLLKVDRVLNGTGGLLHANWWGLRRARACWSAEVLFLQQIIVRRGMWLIC